MKKSRKNTIFLILFCLLIVTAITLLVVFALQNKGTPIGGGNTNTGVTNPNEPNVRLDDGTDKKKNDSLLEIRLFLADFSHYEDEREPEISASNRNFLFSINQNN